MFEKRGLWVVFAEVHVKDNGVFHGWIGTLFPKLLIVITMSLMVTLLSPLMSAFGFQFGLLGVVPK
jgi:hypothetical protein